MTWLPDILPGSPAVWLGVAIWTAVVAWGASRVTQWAAPEPEVPPPDTVYAEGPLDWGDLMEPTMPDQVTVYDTIETRTECVQVPTWLADPQDFTTRSDGITTSADGGGREAIFPTPRIAVTPLFQGSPPVSVGAEEITVSGYVRGQGRTWTYDVPQNRWGIGIDGSVTAGKWLQATSTMGVSRMTQWGPIDVTSRLGGGYGALVTDEYRAGPVVRTTLSLTYDW